MAQSKDYKDALEKLRSEGQSPDENQPDNAQKPEVG